MSVLNRSQILNKAKKAPTLTPVVIAAWGGTFYIKPMDCGTYELWEQSICDDAGNQKKQKAGFLRASVVACSLCDKNGNMIFKPEDAIELAKGDAGPINIVFNKASEINALTNADVEEMLGNSEGTD